MKRVIPFLFLLMSCSCVMCTGKVRHNTSAVSMSKMDTIVSVELISKQLSGAHFTEKEYFVSAGQDTSALSCIICVKNEDSTLRVELLSNSRGKRFQISKDTNAIANKNPDEKVRYHKLYNDDLIPELKLILNRISDDYDVSKLKLIRFSVLLSGKLSIDITNRYLKKTGKRKAFDYESIENDIYNSPFIENLNQIVDAHSIHVDEVDIEMPSIVSKNREDVSALLDGKSENVPNKALDFLVSVYFKPSSFNKE